MVREIQYLQPYRNVIVKSSKERLSSETSFVSLVFFKVYIIIVRSAKKSGLSILSELRNK